MAAPLSLIEVSDEGMTLSPIFFSRFIGALLKFRDCVGVDVALDCKFSLMDLSLPPLPLPLEVFWPVRRVGEGWTLPRRDFPPAWKTLVRPLVSFLNYSRSFKAAADDLK